MLVYPNDYKTALDFAQVLEQIKSKTNHQRIIDLVDETTYPIDNFAEISNRIKETRELANLLKAGDFPNFSYIDLNKSLNILGKEGSVLFEDEVLNIRRASLIVNELLDFFEQNPIYHDVTRNFEDVYFTTDITKEIDKILDIHGNVRSSASRELEKIRKKLAEKRNESDRRFQSTISRLKNQHMLRDFEETIFKNRRVLAVPAEHKRTVKGHILSHSANQLTAYIEPQGNLKLNLEIDELVEEERREVFKILRVLSQFLRQHIYLIKAYDQCLVNMELLRAKARYANDISGVAPQLTVSPSVNLLEAYHPVLLFNYKQQKKKVIPLNLDLTHDHTNVVVLSGPNAGGKSVSLKTLGLIQVMVQSGLLVPVDEASEIGIFKKIFVDVGDTQSIENELSTYSSKLTRLKYFVEQSDNESLFLIDEFGTGSDPELGGALAEAILEELVKSKAIGLVNTHYANIKKFAENHEKVINANMLFDVDNLKPKFELVIGMPGSSYTFEVAENTGMPKQIVNAAKSKLGKGQLGFDALLSTYSKKLESLEKQLKSIQSKERELKSKQTEASYIKETFEERIKEDKQKAAEWSQMMQYGRFLQDILSEYDKKKSKKVVTEKILKKYQSEKVKQLENKKSAIVKKAKTKRVKAPKINPADFKVGDAVRLKSSHQEGQIEGINKGKAEVTVGFVKTFVDLKDLRPITKKSIVSKSPKKPSNS